MLRYYSNQEKRNRVTIVAEFKEGFLKFASARTSSKDRFVKKIGRSIAENRLKGDHINLITPCIKENMVKTFLDKAKYLEQHLIVIPNNVHEKF